MSNTTKKIHIYKLFFIALIVALFFAGKDAHALPAFAAREHVSCVMCHTNGAYPHLTKMGFLYRRAGFRFPADIGNDEKDNATLDLLHHLAAGINIDAQLTQTKTPATNSTTTSANGIGVRELEIFPIVGAFRGNFGAWSELDFNPAVDGNASAISFEMGDLRGVMGDSESFFGFRVGLIAPEGFGASDQWLDDGNIPMMDTATVYYNQDTLVTPFGPMQSPQSGTEFEYSTTSIFYTLGIYNGVDGSKGSASPAGKRNAKDFKLQIDKFLGDQFALTAGYYAGSVYLPSIDQASVWEDHFQAGRVYLSYFPHPDWEVLAGGAYSKHQYNAATGSGVDGNTQAIGGFGGAIYHVKPHLSLGARYDYVTLASVFPDDNGSTPNQRGLSLMASLPYEYNNFVFHVNYTDTNAFYDTSQTPAVHLSQNTLDARAEWRFLF